MTTSHNILKGKDFAEQAVNALADLKRANPTGWKQALEPFKNEIKAEAESSKTTLTSSVLNILSKANAKGLTMAALKMQHFFYLAAYIDMI